MQVKGVVAAAAVESTRLQSISPASASQGQQALQKRLQTAVSFNPETAGMLVALAELAALARHVIASFRNAINTSADFCCRIICQLQLPDVALSFLKIVEVSGHIVQH